MVELDAPTDAEKRRQRKRMHKFKMRSTQAYGGTEAQKLAKENAKLKLISRQAIGSNLMITKMFIKII